MTQLPFIVTIRFSYRVGASGEGEDVGVKVFISRCCAVKRIKCLGAEVDEKRLLATGRGYQCE